MGEREAIEWIVDGFNNIRIKEYLGPLGRYKKASKLLTDLRGAATYLKDATTEDKRANGNSKGTQQRCYRCKQIGHTANKCTESKSKVTCFKCGKTGHISRACTENAQKGSPGTTTQDKPASVLHISGDTHQKYFKDAYLNGRLVRCYVDLGSSVVTLREDTANEMGLTYHETTLNSFVGYGEGRVQPLDIMTTDISVDGVQVRTDVHVVPRGSQAVPMIIGHPYTENPEVVIISGGGELRVTTKADNPMQITPSAADKTTLRASEMHVIPNNYVGHIFVDGEHPNQSLCVEGGVREVGPIVPRCIVATDEEGRAVLPVLNVTGRPITIKPGDTISRGELCTEGTFQREVNDEPVTLEQIDTDMQGEEARQLIDNRTLNDNRELIARTLQQLGKTSDATMRIELTSDRPVIYRPYRLSYYERKQMKDMVDELKAAEIIEDSASPHASPMLLVKKKNGEMRMCIDYHALNKITVKDKYPLPRIDDQLDRLQGQEYYTSIDLSSGYYEVEVELESRDKTAFVTPDGQYQFRRMPFGLCNAPSVFQRLINKILGSFRHDIALAYLDDIIIPSMTVEEGLTRLQDIL